MISNQALFNLAKMKSKIPLAWLQLKKEKLLFLVAMAGISFADILMFMQLGFKDALYDSNTKIHSSLRGDLFLINTQSETLTYMESFSQRRLDQSLAVPGVRSVSTLHIGVIRWKNPENRQRSTILALGVNPSNSPFDLPDIQQNIEKTKLPNVVLFDRASNPKFGTDHIVREFEQGHPVVTEIGGKRMEIGGLFTVGASFAADGNFITSDTNFLRLLRLRDSRSIEIGIITLEPNINPKQVKEYLLNYLPKDVRILTKSEFIDFEKEYWSRSTPIGYLFSLGAIMGFVVGAVIVYQILYTNVSNHLSEYATLKAMGYTNFYLLQVILQQSLILAFLGYFPGFFISSGLYVLAQNATMLPIVMKLNRAAFLLLLTFLMCFIAGSFAILRLRKTDPADIFE